MESFADTAVFIRDGKLVAVRELEEMRETENKSMTDKYREIYGHVEAIS